MSQPEGPRGPTHYTPEIYAVLRACNSAVSAQILLLEIMEAQTTPHGAEQRVRYTLATQRLKNALEWLKNAQRPAKRWGPDVPPFIKGA